MCDTIGKIISNQYAIFGKNSDRAVNEPQITEFYKAEDYPKGTKLKCTYIEIEQATHTNAIVLSRPTWLWGGEIGVNEYGVCIGNEAVFTKGKYGEAALIGMDLLRLGLERGTSAKEALEVIINLLKRYGQGGNCGFDSDFHYDNSFLIMDRKEIYILDTKDKEYCYKKVQQGNISNCLNIEEDGDVYSNERCSFASRYSDFIFTTGSKGKVRRLSGSSRKLENLEDMIHILSSHTQDDVFAKGSVGSVCMHAANPLTADATTASMIVELKEKEMIIWITGSSLPCISLYKPHRFKDNGLISQGVGNDTFWKERERYNRLFISKEIPAEYYSKKEEYQNKIIESMDTDIALELEKEFISMFNPEDFRKKRSSFIYRNFWISKNKLL